MLSRAPALVIAAHELLIYTFSALYAFPFSALKILQDDVRIISRRNLLHETRRNLLRETRRNLSRETILHETNWRELGGGLRRGKSNRRDEGQGKAGGSNRKDPLFARPGYHT